MEDFSTIESNIALREVKKNPSVTSAALQRAIPEFQEVSTRTIRHHLCNDLKLSARKAQKKPLFTPKMRQQRLAFCKLHKDWSLEQWKEIMFSDESQFKQFEAKPTFVRHPSGSSAESPRYITLTVKPSLAVVVWSCFLAHGRGGPHFLGKGEMTNSQKYLEVLKDKMCIFMELHTRQIFHTLPHSSHRGRVVCGERCPTAGLAWEFAQSGCSKEVLIAGGAERGHTGCLVSRNYPRNLLQIGGVYAPKTAAGAKEQGLSIQVLTVTILIQSSYQENVVFLFWVCETFYYCKKLASYLLCNTFCQHCTIDHD